MVDQKNHNFLCFLFNIQLLVIVFINERKKRLDFSIQMIKKSLQK